MASDDPYGHVGVIGAGAWGTALAIVLARIGRRVTLWARDATLVARLHRDRRHPRGLGDAVLDPAMQVTTDLAAAAAAEAILLVVPAQAARALCQRLAPMLAAGTPMVICAKGVELGSGRLLPEVLAHALPQARVAVLSGPTFAEEVARGLPTAVTLAAADGALAARLAATVGDAAFRPYVSDDVTGAAVGGAVKNVIAIACGIAIGRGFGDNGRAALITRGLAEVARFGRGLGARSETLMGLSGLGDLVLTCTSTQSRNYSLGLALGRGVPLADALAAAGAVVEGEATAAALGARAAEARVHMPIAHAVDQVLHAGASIDTTIRALLARPFAQPE